MFCDISRSIFSDIFDNHFLLLSSRFIQEIEHALGLGPAKQCPLRDFLTVYIKNIFLNQVLAEINKEIEGVTKTSDPLKILANADTMKVMGVQRPLLQVIIYFELNYFCQQFSLTWQEAQITKRRITICFHIHQRQNKRR